MVLTALLSHVSLGSRRSKVRTGSGAISQWQHREADTWGMKAKSPDTVRMLTHTQNLLPLINVIGHGEVNQAQ